MNRYVGRMLHRHRLRAVVFVVVVVVGGGVGSDLWR